MFKVETDYKQELIKELKEQNKELRRKLNLLMDLFSEQICNCKHCGEYKRAGFGCVCGK